MALRKLELRIVQGDARTWPVTLRAGGLPLDITGATLLLTIKPDIDLPDADPQCLQVRVTSHTDAAVGRTAVAVSSAQSLGLAAGRAYLAELKLIAAGGEPWTIVQGTLTVLRPIGRAVA